MKDARIQVGLTARDAVRALRHTGSRVDTPLYSKMEHGLCYPNRQDRETLAKLYDTHPDALASYNTPPAGLATGAERAEAPSQTKRSGDRHKLSTRISYRISAEQHEKVEQAVKVCGYSTVQNWLTACTYRLLDEASNRMISHKENSLPPIEPGGEYDPFRKE